MTAEVIPFPAARRVDLVRSVVRRALELPPHAGEKHIQRSIDLQAIVMRRKGIPEDLIAKESEALEGAIRRLVWDSVMSPRSAR